MEASNQEILLNIGGHYIRVQKVYALQAVGNHGVRVTRSGKLAIHSIALTRRAPPLVAAFPYLLKLDGSPWVRYHPIINLRQK